MHRTCGRAASPPVWPGLRRPQSVTAFNNRAQPVQVKFTAVNFNHLSTIAEREVDFQKLALPNPYVPDGHHRTSQPHSTPFNLFLTHYFSAVVVATRLTKINCYVLLSPHQPTKVVRSRIQQATRFLTQFDLEFCSVCWILHLQ